MGYSFEDLQDMIKDMDIESVHFIVNILNQLNIDKLRNILSKTEQC